MFGIVVILQHPAHVTTKKSFCRLQ